MERWRGRWAGRGVRRRSRVQGARPTAGVGFHRIRGGPGHKGGARRGGARPRPRGTRSRSAPFLIFDADGRRLGTTYVDQATDGSRWVELGTWAFTAGWNAVALSRWTTPGDIVVADAVRVRSVE